MERRERIGHLLGSAEANVRLAVQMLRDYGEVRMGDTREFAKKAKQALKQAIEAIDGVD